MCACGKKDTTLSVVDTQICKEQYIDVNGVTLCYFEWGTPAADAPTILLVHATGFHARCWDQTIKHLQGRHVIAVDMRNHGRSTNTTGVGWEVYGDDLKAFVAIALFRRWSI
jgi:pimeloyl-ACP methyl ester carboxylesterase